MKSKKKTGATPDPRALTLFFLAAPYAAGLFFEYLSAIAALFLIGWLVYCRRKSGVLILRKSSALIASSVLALAYLLSALWAVDRAMALVGFVKFLPLPLFVLACMQLREEERDRMLALTPYSAVVMTVLAAVLGLVPAWKDVFYVNSRLAGFFEYPNTYALYAAVSIALLLKREEPGVREYGCFVVLFLGVALSGSRTVMALLAVMVVVYCVILRDKRRRFALPILLALTLGGAAIYASATGDVSSAGRYLTTSAGASTLLGRLLYYRDALPVILRHPFGLGYTGYWYMQGSFQTGVYSVMHVHNELMQYLLDVGWIPAGLLVWAVIRGFLKGDTTRRVAIALVAAHSMLDFDTQFVSVSLLLLLLLPEEGKSSRVRLPNSAICAVGGILAALCLYLGTATALGDLGLASASAAIYPVTASQVTLLEQAEDAQSMDELAEDILAHNESVSLAWSAKARRAYSEGDFGAVIEYKRRAIECAKYSLEEYLDYADMLRIGERLYSEAGDAASASVCREELAAIPDMLRTVLDGTSALAWRIADQPELTLPEEYSWLLAY